MFENVNIIELCDLGFAPGWPRTLCESPTDSSISFISKTLKVILPESMIYVAKSCKFYSNYYAGLGADYDSPWHILKLNDEIRRDYVLPPNLILINNGHDGDCICFDISEVKENGEHPIVYWDGEEEGDQTATIIAESFEEYILSSASHYAKIRDPERAAKLLNSA